MGDHWLRDCSPVSLDLMEAHPDGELPSVFLPLWHSADLRISKYIRSPAHFPIYLDTPPLYIYLDIGWMMEAWQDARTPALAIVARGDQIETASPTTYMVRSQSHPGVAYSVSVVRERWSCSCDFFGATKAACVHILAVRLRQGFKESVAPVRPEATLCARCQSGYVILYGKRQTKAGVVRRYLCKSCGFRFTGRDGFKRRRADPEKIALALDLYFRGMSVRKIAEHFGQVYGLKMSHVTVYKWVVHFGKIAAEWMDAQGAKVGDHWNVDETVVSVDGRKEWVWNVLDADTRFLLATHVSKNRSLANTRAPLAKAREVAGRIPVEVRTDGMGSYPEAMHREFGRRHRPEDGPSCRKNGGRKNQWTPHRVVPSIRAPESNNLIERLHGTEKERIKVMRGFDTRNGTAALMEGFRAHYNLVRDHQTLGKTPGVAAGLPAVSGFRWHEILKQAAQEKKASKELVRVTN
jgi:putative transposase